MSSGIYLLRNKIDRKVYIGQSTNLTKRKRQHKNLMMSRKHFNEHLQNAYDKYGMVFEFEIIEYADEDKLDELEMYWMDFFKSTNKKFGYNILKGGTQFKKHSEESKDKIRIANQGLNSKLTIKDVMYIKKYLVNDYDLIKLSKKFNVSKATISKIGTCVNWKWVLEELNYTLLNREEILKQKIKCLWSENKSASQISKETNTSIKKVCSILKNEIKEKNDRIKKRNKEILVDYNKGLSKSEIIKKYNIGLTTFVRITSTQYNKNKQELMSKVYKLIKDGMNVKDVAKELNIHPCTVTRYIKRINANTEIIQ